MKIEKKYKPELICSKDATRPSIQETYATKHKGKPVLVATDGRRLLAVPIEVDNEKEYGYIPKAALKFAKASLLERRSTFIQFSANGKITFSNGWTMPRDNQQVFPKWETVIPKEAPETIAINAKLLYELAQSMGCETVALHIGEKNEGIIVKPTENNEAFGVLMPVRHA